jgi:hypothetical protein
VASSLAGTVSGPYIAKLLTQKLGYGVSAGEPYYAAGCAAPAQCVFPNAVIPRSAWSSPAVNLLKYIPVPNNANNTFSTAAFNQTLNDDKGAYRLDANTHWGLMSAYYFLDGWSQKRLRMVNWGHWAGLQDHFWLPTGRFRVVQLVFLKESN